MSRAAAEAAPAPSGQTVIPVTPGHPSGAINIKLGERDYSGSWVYMSGPGAASVRTAAAFSGPRVATGFAVTLAAPMQGGGIVTPSAADAPGIRCRYSYSAWSESGIGAWEGDAGGSYDVMSSR